MQVSVILKAEWICRCFVSVDTILLLPERNVSSSWVSSEQQAANLKPFVSLSVSKESKDMVVLFCYCE